MKSDLHHFLILKLTALFLMLMGLTACDSLFSTREAEPPETQRSSWNPPFSPDLVLGNMQNAILERNVENFVKCLADTTYSRQTYRFIPDEQVLSSHPELFLLWTRLNEQWVMQQAFSMLPEDSLAYLQFPTEIRDVVTADSAVLGREYHLELHHIQPEMPMIFEGRMELYMAPDEKGEWAIYRWIDYNTTEQPSWSFLKATLGG